MSGRIAGIFGIAGIVATMLMLGACALAPGPPSLRRPHAQPDPWVLGQLVRHRVENGDNLVALSRAYGVGYVEMVAANPGVDPWLPAEGTELIIPDAHVFPDEGREGIVINVAEQRLYFFSPDGPRTYAIGVARDGWTTPRGSTTVVRKQEDPVWYPPKSARAEDPTLGPEVAPGPDNPLGSHALYLGWPAYLIHGTNEPFGIGRRVSRGCVRLYPEDIAPLYRDTPLGTPVRVIDRPEKIAIVRGQVVLEAHPTLEQASQLEETGSFDPTPMPASLRSRLRALVRGTPHRVDWALVESVSKRRRGVPIRVSAEP